MISLGSFCSVATEIGRYGLRDASYPFDWVTCGLECVLELMDSHFEGFLELDQLSRRPGYEYIVDSASGIGFYHDFDSNITIAQQLDSVKQKYARRVDRLYQSASRRTLFVRYMSGPDEYQYLDSHMCAVMELLRRGNPKNDLLLVGNAELPDRCAGQKIYRVEVDQNDVVARDFIRKSPQLHWDLIFLRYPFVSRCRNYRRNRLRTREQAGLATRIIRKVKRTVLGDIS